MGESRSVALLLTGLLFWAGQGVAVAAETPLRIAISEMVAIMAGAANAMISRARRRAQRAAALRVALRGGRELARSDDVNATQG